MRAVDRKLFSKENDVSPAHSHVENLIPQSKYRVSNNIQGLDCGIKVALCVYLTYLTLAESTA